MSCSAEFDIRDARETSCSPDYGSSFPGEMSCFAQSAESLMEKRAAPQELVAHQINLADWKDLFLPGPGKMSYSAQI